MNFSKQIISPITDSQELTLTQMWLTQLKNAFIIDGSNCKLFIQNFSDKEILRFKNYWNQIKLILKLEEISKAEYHLRWEQYAGSELYEFEIDSFTGHRITFGFYPEMKEYDLYFYQDINQRTHTFFITGKTQNLVSSHRVKDIIELFHS